MTNRSVLNLLSKRAENLTLDVLVADLTETLSDLMGEAWEGAYSDAIETSVKEMSKQSTKENGLKALLISLSSLLSNFFTSSQKEEIQVVVDGIYSSFKNFYSGKLNIDAQFFTLDKKSIKYIANEGPYWIGNFYSNHLSQRISEIGRAIVLDSSIGLEQGSMLMKGLLEKELALSGGGSGFISEIPAPFAGRVGNYTNIVSVNSAVKARSFSNIISFDNANIETYEFSAIIDNRTSEICQYMHGKRFSVVTAVDLIDRVTSADTPDEVKGITPWVSAKSAVNIGGKGTIESQSENLASAGIMMPPLHGL